MNDGDWFHTYNTFQDSSFRMREANEVTSQSAGYEAVYIYIAKFVNYNYFLFRFIVWGAAGLFSYILGKRLEVNNNLFLFFFIVICLDVFSFQRGSLAMAMGFLGYSYIIKPINNKKIISFILGLLLVYSSIYFHKSALFLIPVFLASFLRINKSMLVVVVLALPIVVYLVNSFLGGYLLDMVGADDSIMNTNMMQLYLTRENRNFGIGSAIRNVLMPTMFILLFIYCTKYVIVKKIPLQKQFIRMYNCAFIIVLVSLIIATLNTVNVSIIYMRLLYYSALPFTLVISSIYNQSIHKGSTPFIIVFCILCTVYKIVLNLLGTIFL